MRGSVLAATLALTMAPAQWAQAQSAVPERSAIMFRMPIAVKGTGLLTHDARESLARVRIEPEVTARGNAVFTMAYEHRLHAFGDTPSLSSLAIFPPETRAPFRIWQLDWSVQRSRRLSWRQEVDRANVRLAVRRSSLTIGRQAIGWGRGAIFGAVDLFAPFSPLEIDREWRRGVDAVRADVPLTDRSSLDLVGAFGSAWNQSAVAARVRGYVRAFDIEVVGGRRATDLFGGVTTSAPVGDAELHGEVAAFRAPDPGAPSQTRVVWKAVAGGSFRIPIGAGAITYAEYHYSGFGAPRPELIVPLLTTTDFAERYLRGDMQVLTRHAIALTSTYEPSPRFAFAAQWICSPLDRSGVASPAITVTMTDALSLLGTVHLPYGRDAAGPMLRSEFGALPLSGLLQLRLYW